MSAWRRWLPLLLLLWLATGLRFYRLDAQSLWNDEGNSARLSERSLPLIVEGTASDIHPPLYYLLLAGWRQMVGAHEFGLRSLSAMAGVLTVAATFAFARRWGRTPAHVAGLLTAIAPPLVYYSQEARMYSLLALWAILSTFLLVRWRARPGPGRAAAYSVVVAAGLYTHYFFPAVLAGHLLLAALTVPRRRWASLLAAWVAAGALFAPWLPIFVRQAGGRPAPTVAVGAFLRSAGQFMVGGETPTEATAVAGVVATGVLLLLALGRLPERRRWLFVTAVGVPIAAMAAAGATRPAFLKFLVVAVPPLWVVAAGAWGEKWSLRQWLATGVLLILLGALTLGLGALYFDPQYARADYRAMAARVAADEARTAVVLDAPNQWEVFTYYYPAVDDVYPLPLGAADPARIDATLGEVAGQYERVYALFWGETERDPERLVERWLDAHAFKAGDVWYDDVRFVTYAFPPDADAPVTRLDVPVGEAIVLEGVALGARAARPGAIIPLTLLWRAERPLDERYKVFLHLLDGDGRLVAQRDAEPGGGLAPTTGWPPGETIRDNHGLLVPPDLPSGTYELRTGLYDLADSTRRLPIASGIDNALSLGLIEVAP